MNEKDPTCSDRKCTTIFLMTEEEEISPKKLLSDVMYVVLILKKKKHLKLILMRPITKIDNTLVVNVAVLLTECITLSDILKFMKIVKSF